MKNFLFLFATLLLSSTAGAATPRIKTNLDKFTLKADETFSLTYSLINEKNRKISSPFGSLSLNSYTDSSCSENQAALGQNLDLSMGTTSSYSFTSPGTFYIKPSLSGYSGSCIGPISVLSTQGIFERLVFLKLAQNGSIFDLKVEMESTLGQRAVNSTNKISLSLKSTSDCSGSRIKGTRVLTGTPKNGSVIFKVNRPNAQSVYACASSGVKTASFLMTEANNTPVSFSQSVSTDEDMEKSILLSANDADGTNLTYSIVSEPIHGTLLGSGSSFLYHPNQNYNGLDSFTFKANDGSVDSNVSTVSITVNPVNDSPVAFYDSFSGATAGAAFSISKNELLLNDSDIESIGLLQNYIGLYVTSVSNPSTGTVSISGDDIIFTPSISFNGRAIFHYTISDGSDSSSSFVYVDVVCASGYHDFLRSGTCVINNRAPVAIAQSVSTDEDTSKSITLSATDSDGDSLTYFVVSRPSHGTLSGSAPNLTYTPELDFSGSDSFTFKSNDGTMNSDPVTVSITINPVNDAPVSVADTVSGTAIAGSAFTISSESLLENDSDVENSSLSLTSVSDPSTGTVSIAGGNVVFTPAINFAGTASFTYSISDGSLTSSASVTVSVDCAVGYILFSGVCRQDLDGDGFASSVYGGGDCNDLNSNINPLSSEICDNIDNNCNGFVDDNDQTVAVSSQSIFYLDANLDGSGDLNGATRSACVKPQGYTSCQPGTHESDSTCVSNNPEISFSKINYNTSVFAGNSTSCYIDSSGSFKCWGENAHGQLGNKTISIGSSTAIAATIVSGVKQLAPGGRHNCALMTDSSVKCWGGAFEFGPSGTTASDRINTPITISGITSATMISSGFFHVCSLLSDKTVSCFGWNENGQLGNGTNSSGITPVQVSGLQDVIKISAGYYHTCALTTSGSVKCWGLNQYQQLGTSSNVNSSTPVQVYGLTSGVISISSGAYHTCALMSSGSVKCWGYNNYGQLGVSLLNSLSTAVDVSGLDSGNTEVFAGESFSCVLTSTGGVKCWGYNGNGELGDGTSSNKFTPSAVIDLSSGVISASAGRNHVCALTSIGDLKCWGDNTFGQIGNNSTTDSSVPVGVVGSGGIAESTRPSPKDMQITGSCFGSNTIKLSPNLTNSISTLCQYDRFYFNPNVLDIDNIFSGITGSNRSFRVFEEINSIPSSLSDSTSVEWPELFNFNQTILTNSSNYNLYNSAISAGWDGFSRLNATVTIGTGIYVYSSITTSFAFSTNDSTQRIPEYSKVKIINNGSIVGKGGTGGRAATSTAAATNGGNGGGALYVNFPIEIENNGTIGGGGGGGGGGGARSAQFLGNTTLCLGSGGGGGAGFGVAGSGNSGFSSPSSGNLTSGGAGGSVLSLLGICVGGVGGTGGTLGISGGFGSSGSGGTSLNGGGKPGGQAGPYLTKGASGIVTWATLGTRIGAEIQQ